MFENGNMSCNSLIGMVLLLFNGKGLKAFKKDNYRGITPFHVILKVFEMIILNRLEKFAKDGKGLKAFKKDNYRGITPFHVILKVFEMIILNRLEKFAKDEGYFSQLQFGFREGTGCMEA